MKHLSKEKKQQLLLVVLGTAVIMVGLWFGLINWQKGRLGKLAAQRETTRAKLDNMTDTLKRASEIAAQVDAGQEELNHAEEQMASGDHYAWIINTIRGFKTRHPRVDIPNYSTILLGDTTLLPKFPYRQAKLTVAGRAFYHDLGAFIADFENDFPYLRLENLEIEPEMSPGGGYSERLSFKMDVVALVRPEA